MSALTFDTHEAIQVLIAKDLTSTQAEGITQVVKQAQDSHLEQLATKADLKVEIAGVKGEITEVKGELKLLKWMLALVIAVNVLPLLKILFM